MLFLSPGSVNPLRSALSFGNNLTLMSSNLAPINDREFGPKGVEHQGRVGALFLVVRCSGCCGFNDGQFQSLLSFSRLLSPPVSSLSGFFSGSVTPLTRRDSLIDHFLKNSNKYTGEAPAQVMPIQDTSAQCSSSRSHAVYPSQI